MAHETELVEQPLTQALSAASSSPDTADNATRVAVKGKLKPSKGRKNRGREKPGSKQDAMRARLLREQCQRLATSIFYNDQVPLRSLGFTSVVAGEGKSFLATTTAVALANNTSDPVTILECNWEHPSLADLFGVPSGPGLAEWARGECPKTAIRYPVSGNLTVIPAGDGQVNILSTLQQIRQRSLLDARMSPNELLIVDFPPVLTCSYGAFAASLVETLVIVVRAGTTPLPMVAETCDQLRGLPIHGVLLNDLKSNLPRWLSRLL